MSDKGLLSEIYSKLSKLNSQKITNVLKAQKTLNDSSPKRIYECQVHTWKDARHHPPLEKNRQTSQSHETHRTPGAIKCRRGC